MKIDETEAHVYTYDVLYQLTNVDYNDGNSTAYYYDDLGNRTSVVNGGTISYNSNSLNEYTSVGGTGYSYDDNGNLTNDGTYLYYYDCENRLTEVNDINDSPVTSYAYDYLGRRVSKTQYAIPDTQYYAYDGDQVIAEYDSNDNLLRKFICGPRIDEPIMMIDVTTSAKYYYHFDGLGSVAALSDTSANIVERYSYDVFGEPNRESDVNNPYLFTGRRIDPETSNYYYRARYYAPKIGRFLQVDPLSHINTQEPITKLVKESILSAKTKLHALRIRTQAPATIQAQSPLLAINVKNANHLIVTAASNVGRQYNLLLVHSYEMNLYRYCQSNPLNNIDPSGLFDCDWGGLGFCFMQKYYDFLSELPFWSFCGISCKVCFSTWHWVPCSACGVCGLKLVVEVADCVNGNCCW